MNNVIEDYKALEELIFDDNFRKDISLLGDKVKENNIFEIVGMRSQELKHSNFLEWLFKNNSKHFNDIFLTEFLLRTIEVTQKHIERGYDDFDSKILKELKEDLIFTKIRDIEVSREYKNIDILIVDKQNKHLFCIENKVNAVESEDQLGKYKEITENEFSDYHRYYIFLNPDETKPQKEKKHYMISSYYIVKEVIDYILRQKELNLSFEIKLILESYVDLLIREEIIMEKDIEVLANKIWGTYGDKITTLLKYKPDLKTIITEIIDENEREIKNESGNGRQHFFFYPIKLHKKLQEKFSIDSESVPINFWIFEDTKSRIVYWSLVKYESLINENAQTFFDLVNGEKLFEQIIDTSKKSPEVKRSELIAQKKLFNLNEINLTDAKTTLTKLIKETIDFSNRIAGKL